MKLTTTNYWNPFFFSTTDEKYYGQLERIMVFDDDSGEILALSRAGWFGNHNNEFKNIEFECDLVFKRQFNIKNIKRGTAIVTKNTDSGNYTLYLPNSVIKLSESKFFPYLSTKEAFVEERHSTVYNGVYFEMIHWINHNLLQLKSERSEFIQELSREYYDTKKAMQVLDKLRDKYIEIEKEEERLKEITLDEFLSKYYKKGGWAQ